MSSDQRQFVAFEAFEPDTVDFDNPKLDVAENVTPSYGAYRPIEKLLKVAEVTDANPLRGGYCHLSGKSNPVIKLNPLGTPVGTNVGNWYTKDVQNIEGSDVTDYGVDQVKGPSVDDTTWIRSSAITSQTASKAVWFLFAETPRVPVTDTNDDEVEIRVRVRTHLELGNGLAPGHIDYTLYDTSTDDTIVTGTFDLADPHTEDWQDFSFVLTDLQTDDVDDWATLELKLEPYWDVMGIGAISNVVPVADEYFDSGWKADDGSSVDMWEHVNNTSDGPPDYDVYVDSPYVGKGDASTVIFKIDQVDLPSDPDVQVPTFNSYVTATAGNVSVKMRVLQAVAAEDADDEEDDFWLFEGQNFIVLAEKTVDNISTDQDTPTISTVAATAGTPDLDLQSASQAWIDALDPLKAVYASVTVTYGGDEDNVGLVTLVPNAKIGSGGWGGAVDGNELGDGNDSSKVAYSPPTTTGGNKYDFPEGSSRSSKNDHKIRYRGKINTGANGNVRLKLYHGTTLVQQTPYKALTTSWADYSVNISGTKVDGPDGIPVDGYDDIEIKVEANSSDGAELYISELSFEYPGDSAQARVYEVFGDVGHADRMEFSHIQMEIADPAKTNVGDFNEVYVGTDTDLYEVTSFGFTDVTRSGDDYGDESTDTPRLWSFTSWGDDVIATNYADEVQRRELGATKFTDLITSTIKPQARFCAVVGGHLVLADINPASSGYADGKPYHLWCSYLLSPTDFDSADYDNQSAIFPLISKPGAITGLIGGEYGWVFKRNSVWRMTYVGLPPIFQFDMVMEGIGCSHPQSIVSAGGDVYFWGGGAIHRIGAAGYQRLSGQRIEKYIFDTAYEPSGLLNVYTNDSRENDSVVWGSFDAYSGLIWWLYRTPDETNQSMLDNIVIYSVIEDRFTTLKDSSLDLSLLIAQQNVATNEPVLHRSMQAFRYTGSTTENLKFLDDVTYSGTLKTKIITPTSWGSQVGKDAEVMFVRPMYISQPDIDTTSYGATELPNFTITLTGAQDPTLRIGRQTRIVTRVRENRQGWIPIKPINSEFWQFEVTFPEMYRATVKEFLGLQLRTREAGDG